MANQNVNGLKQELVAEKYWKLWHLIGRVFECHELRCHRVCKQCGFMMVKIIKLVLINLVKAAVYTCFL